MDLLPCPFCGKRSLKYNGVAQVEDYAGTRCRLHCMCGAVGPWGAATQQDAVTAWNTRTPSEAVLVEALRQQVRDLDNLTKEYRSVFDVQSPESEILRLQNALRDIAFLRPGGPTRNKLAMQMERIAIDALDALAAAKGERV